jgi:hypothetical protein
MNLKGRIRIKAFALKNRFARAYRDDPDRDAF